MEIARGYLARHRDLYGIDVSTLRSRGVSRRAGITTVRFTQTRGGVDVFGGSYLVHLDKKDGGYSPTSANGEYFTDLAAPTEPRISEDDAVRWARLRSRGLIASKVQRHGLTVLPARTGALTYHLTLWGTRYGRALTKETFVNADNGTIALAYDNLQRAEGTGTNAHDEPVTFTVTDPPSPYQMKTPRMIETYVAGPDSDGFYRPGEPGVQIASSETLAFDSEHTTSGAIDAHDKTEEVDAYFSGLNDGLDIGADLQDIRTDDRIISTVNVRDPSTGGPMFNAFWDGTQVVYGNPPESSNVLPLSAAADVVAHELTHGLDQVHVGDGLGLLYINQSGAMNEAYSDYFGEAAELHVNGLGMADPDAGKIGEDLCTDPPHPPGVWECPLRDLDPADENAPHTADYHYLLIDVDNGGVHENSGPFAGALWDIRKALFTSDGELGAKRADQYIFTALAEWTTPHQNFVGGRKAVVEAAKAVGVEMGLPQGQIDIDVATINEQFDDHGIEQGWETPSSATGTILYKDVVPVGEFLAPPQVSGNRFIIGNYKRKRDIYGPQGIFVGRTDCAGCRKVSVGGRNFSTFSNESPDIHGKRAVWTHISRRFAVDVRSRILGKRKITTVAGGSGIQWFPSIDGAGRRGTILAWEHIACSSCDTDIKYRFLGKKPRFVFKDRRGEQWLPQTSKTWVAWWDRGPRARRHPKIGLKNVVTGRTFIFKPPTKNTFMGPPALSDTHLYWYQDTQFYNPGHSNSGKGKIVRVRLGRRTRQGLFKETHSLAPRWDGFSAEPVPSANRRFVTWSDETGLIADPALIAPGRVGRDIFRLRLGTRRIRRVTNNRGDQAFPVVAAPRRGRVLWLDGARAVTDVRIKG
ncbi:MAG: hypothetical protein GEU78_03565 [Actinobacteria bacterium]|nr:hypothetical protein [Actinomycetota bacterium]